MKENLVLMRESISVPNASIKEVTRVPENLKESFEKVHPNATKMNEHDETAQILKEAVALRESVEDKALFDKIIAKLKEEGASSDRKLWKFPVSRFGNKNGNGRIYPRELWENVINNQRDTWCGGYGLADHPLDDSDPGQFKNASIVWLDMMIDDANKLIWAIGTFVGTYGKLAQEIIEAGGKIGFSSSGFGELKLDGMTVNPDTYQLERVADIVTNPSQSVFGNCGSANTQASPLDNKNVEYTKKTVKDDSEEVVIADQAKSPVTPVAIVVENKEETSNLKEAVEVAPKSEIIKENAVDAVAETETKEEPKENGEEMKESNETKPVTKLEKKAIYRFVAELQNEAKQLKNPKDRLEEVSGILSMVETSGDEELISRVEAQLKEEQAALTKIVNDAINLHENVGDLVEFQDSFKKVVMEGKVLNDQVKDYKILAEALANRNKALADEKKGLAAKVATLEAKIKECEIKTNRDSVVDSMYNDSLEDKNKELEESLKMAKHDIESLNKEIENIKATAVKENKEAKTSASVKISEMRKEIERLAAYSDKVAHDNKAIIKESNNRNARAKENIAFLENKVKELTKINESLNKGNKNLEGQIGTLTTKNKELLEAVKSANELLKEKDTEVSALNENVKDLNAKMATLKEEVAIKREEDSYKPAAYTKKAGLSFREETKIENYWKDLKSQYGSAIDPYERQIRFAKTYSESVNAFLRNQANIDESSREAFAAARVSEAITNKDTRKQYLEEAGMKFDNFSEDSVEDINARELEEMKKRGLR